MKKRLFTAAVSLLLAAVMALGGLRLFNGGARTAPDNPIAAPGLMAAAEAAAEDADDTRADEPTKQESKETHPAVEIKNDVQSTLGTPAQNQGNDGAPGGDSSPADLNGAGGGKASDGDTGGAASDQSGGGAGSDTPGTGAPASGADSSGAATAGGGTSTAGHPTDPAPPSGSVAVPDREENTTAPEPTTEEEPVTEEEPTTEEETQEEIRLVTDLGDKTVTADELTGDRLPFYAYLTGGDGSALLKINLLNVGTPSGGEYLTASGVNYSASLTLGVNYITIYVKRGGETLSYVRFTVVYQAVKADEENPEVGDEPPVISTNLDGWSATLENNRFTFVVCARTAKGAVIYSNHIEVRLDGDVVRNPTGGSVFEYELCFSAPNVGEYEDHAVTVLAWDDDGNSAFKSYTVTYRYVDVGDTAGSAEIVLDATTVGLGVLDTWTYEIVNGDTAADALLGMLDAYGYEAVYNGTPKIGFYLRRVGRGDLCARAAVPSALWDMILLDGIQTNPLSRDRDSLGEFDYTKGSGWMYSVNNGYYPGKALSNYYLTDGDTLYIRFTLSYGKDIGGYDATRGGYGSLTSYGGLWINGAYTPLGGGEETTNDPLSQTAYCLPLAFCGAGLLLPRGRRR